jgi:hypothetical protein
MSPRCSSAATIVAIDCGRTPSAPASALADDAPSFQSRVSAAVCDGVRSSSTPRLRNRRRSRLNSTRRSRAAATEESPMPSMTPTLN